mmetsp:Transcript_34526/g.62604  ORF Transcript_34526/g.62604 Transcript_34526/m.62604 type:complete len:352 (+) Transcript_34526:78-1133(+)
MSETPRISDPETATLLPQKAEQAGSCWSLQCVLSSLLFAACVVCISVIVLVASAYKFVAGGHIVPSAWPEYVDIDQCNESTCVPFWDAQFETKYVRHDDVENVMSYAKAGSGVPESLQGIWWMDQSGALRPSEDYPYYMGPSAEVLASFGDLAVWQEETLCVTPVPPYGGKVAHWTFQATDQGLGMVEEFQKGGTTFHFCFTNDSYKEIQIFQQMAFDKEKTSGKLLHALGKEAWNGSSWFPPWGIDLRMIKHSWGFDRVSNILSNRLRDASRSSFLDRLVPGAVMDDLMRSMHYPVWQIVDGNGKRTEHYDAYLKFMQDPTPSSCGNGSDPIVKNTTHQLYRVLKPGYKL